MKLLEVFLTFLRLGLTSFGGPIAHLSYFHNEFVVKKKWIDETAFADLVALCQFLPGPASSQVGMAIGLSRSGLWGSILAWIGFTLPSAIVLILFGLGLSQIDLDHHAHWLHALKVAAVAVVAQAVYVMAKNICLDWQRILVALISTAAILMTNSAYAQILVLIFGGIFGTLFLSTPRDVVLSPLGQGRSNKVSVLFLIAFVALLIVLPLIKIIYPSQAISFFDSFYRAGSLIYGGGHVVLPMLDAEVVQSGWISKDLFMAGYGMAQAVPGPLFTFAAYLGAVSPLAPNGWSGALLCLIAVFLPGYLILIGAFPFWNKLRRARKEMMGVNAAVVGILAAALYNPVWTSAIFEMKDFFLALIGFVLLEFLKVPSWLCIISFVGLSFLIYN